MMMRYVTALLLLVACEPKESRVNHTWMKPFPISYAFGCDVSEADRPPVREAFNYWNTALGEQAFVENGDCHAVVGVSIGVELKDAFFKNHIAESFRPDLPNSVIIFYLEWHNKSDAWRIDVARHEVGHILGLEHGEFKNCLMYPEQPGDGPGFKVKDACPREIQLVKEAYAECKCSAQ